MKPSRLLHWLGGAALLALLLPAPQAEAVIPSAFGPIQALIALLPQLLMALAALCVAIFKPRTYRLLGAYLLAHKGLTLSLAGTVTLLVWGPWRDAQGEVRQEQAGAPWPAFRGGPGRTGTVEGARGPLVQPHVAWKFVPDTGADVDSSPAIVGNRAYIGIHHKSLLKGSTGSLAAVDTDTGRPAWRYDGSGDLSPGLGPIFSSPAVWAEKGPNDPAPAARYLVSGEGYHDSRNCRILCLDLGPARKGGPPKLHWSVQTTSHVESAPCIHEGRVTIGAGDDGVWCVELATGKVLWRIEGTPFYEVTGGQAEALSKLEGKTVVATGTVERVDLGAKGKDDSGRLVIDVKTFREHSGPPVTSSDSGRSFERTVTGRVAKGRLEIETWVPDSESSPIGVTTGTDPLVLFGSGLGGPRVNCADARTGKILWKTATPYPAFGPPTVVGDRVLIGVGNGNFVVSDPKPAGSLVCLSLRDGKELWTVQAEDTVLGALAVHEKRVYGCSRDGNVYVLDLEKGSVLAKHRAGAAMVCSPAVTADSIYVSTGAGKLLCLEREKGAVRWSQAVSSDMIFSSPAVAGGKVFIGTWGKGLVCIAEREAVNENLPPRPWGGPGGGADRLGTADDRGLPAVQGDEAELRHPTPEGLKRTAEALAACGRRVYAAFGTKLACINAPDGTIAWEVPTRPVVSLTADATRVYVLTAEDIRVLDAASGATQAGILKEKLEADSLALSSPRLFASGKAGLRCLDPTRFDTLWSSKGEPVGPPALAHGLVFVSLKAGRLSCLSETDGKPVWSVALETPPVTPPTVAGDRVYVACAGLDKVKGFLECRKLVDGAPLWRSALEDAATSHVVASADFAVVATADDLLAVLRASDGKAREPLKVDGRPVAPALVRDTLVVAGETRIAAHDLAAADWVWNFKDQDHIGKVTVPPVVAGETIWVATTARGLVAIGIPGTARKP